MTPGERNFSILPVEQTDRQTDRQTDSTGIVWARYIRLMDWQGDVYDVVVAPSAECDAHCWVIINAWLHNACLPLGASCTYPKPTGEFAFHKTHRLEANGTFASAPDWAENCAGTEGEE